MAEGEVIHFPVYLGENPVGSGTISDEEMHIVVKSKQLRDTVKGLMKVDALRSVHIGLRYVPAEPATATAGVKNVETEERHA